MAERGIPPLVTLAGVLFAGGLAASGALALNSYLEMGMDSKMKRTMGRPLPSGRIVPASHALFLGLGVVIYAAVAVVFDLLLLATNIKLFRAPTKANAWLAFKFSSPYLAIIFLAAMVAAVIPG